MSSHTSLRRSAGANLRAGAHAVKAHAGMTGAHPPVCSFPPIANRAARVLVLGSMPGAASLLAGQYYAYRHNAFWPIMGELFGAGPQIAYAKRTLVVKRAGLALWDVMASCIRVGSLDADIDETSIVPNDFHAFFAAHPRLMHVFFNGAKAEHCFNRYVRPHLSEWLRFTRLPSTSPAHAGLSFARKLKAWRAVADALQANDE
jgi:TDG/mug DNA glycosylase family protein